MVEGSPKDLDKGPCPEGWLLLDSIYDVINRTYKVSTPEKKMENMSLWYVIKGNFFGISGGGQKKCYMCSGYGHAAEKCPTAKYVRGMG
jgi:hypothetical protein